MIAVNTPDAFRIGTVGKPMPGVEVMIAADGEILTRGPHVMKGYYNKPEATRGSDRRRTGWFHTGDIGELRDGFLAITDRKKDIIVTAGGKNIAPQPIENKIKTNKYVSQAVVIGDKRKFPVGAHRAQLGTAREVREAQEHHLDRSRAAARDADDPGEDGQGSAEPAHGLARFETPKKIALLEHDFSIERGELTPTLKVKRRVIDKTYKDVIDKLYASEPDGVGV